MYGVSTAASADLGLGRHNDRRNLDVKLREGHCRIRYPDTVHLDFDGIRYRLRNLPRSVNLTKREGPLSLEGLVGKTIFQGGDKSPSGVENIVKIKIRNRFDQGAFLSRSLPRELLQ